MFEHILDWYGKAYGLKHVSLRYFNAAGATELLGEDHRPETHLIPNVLKAALLQPPISNPQSQGLGTRGSGFVSIFGTDYPTKDGSCIRDYVHILDIAQAHILALERLQSPVPGNQRLETGDQGLGARAYNLGNGEGYSVLEVVEAAKKVTGTDIPIEISPRRPGDPAVLVASSERARSELGWKPQFTELGSIVDSAWKWMRKHPKGYGD
jgi:UDP-glucose 4-epimerase